MARTPDFLIEGTECLCDDEIRCDNHDTDAEQTYWGAQFGIRA